jgi:hypothetical protein
MPPGLRSRVLRLASSDTPEAVTHRDALAHRAVMAGATLAGATGVCVSCTLTVNPGDITVTVLIEINASPSPSKPSCPPPSSSAPGAEAVAGCRRSG